MPAGSKRMFVNMSTNACSGTPYWSPWLTEIANASMIPASVEPCFATLRNTSPGRPSSNSPTVAYPWQSATRNENVFDVRVRGSFWRTGCCTITVSTIRSTCWASASAVLDASATSSPACAAFFCVESGWPDLAVVAVDRDRLQAELPRLHVEVFDVLDRRPLRACSRSCEIAPGDERLDRPIIFT